MNRQRLTSVFLIILLLIIATAIANWQIRADTLTDSAMVSNEVVTRIKENSARVTALTMPKKEKQLQTIDDAQTEDQSAQLKQLLTERKELFSDLIKERPSVAIELALPETWRELLPAELQPFVEKREDVTGEYSIIHTHDFAKNLSTNEPPSIRTADGLDLEIFGAIDQIPPADSITLSGVTLDGKMAVSDFSRKSLVTNKKDENVLNSAAPLKKKVLVIVYNFSSEPSEPVTLEDIRQRIFTAPNSVKAYLKENSFGKLEIEGLNRTDGDVIGYYTIPKSADSNVCANLNGPFNDGVLLRKMVTKDGIKPEDYEHIIYVPTKCYENKGLAEQGGNESYVGAITDSFTQIAAHELMHNFGINHANALYCQSSDSKPVSIGGQCSSREYYDVFDVMGNFRNLSRNQIFHVNAFSKAIAMSWLPKENMIKPPASGVYKIRNIESPTTEDQVLVLPTNRLAYRAEGFGSSRKHGQYYIEFRQKVGFDDFDSGEKVKDGLLIRHAPLGYLCGTDRKNDLNPIADHHTQLIYRSPITGSEADAQSITVQGLNRQLQPLTPGQEYFDPDEQVKIKYLSYENDTANVEVTYPNGKLATSCVGVRVKHNYNGNFADSSDNDKDSPTVEMRDTNGSLVKELINTFNPVASIILKPDIWDFSFNFRGLKSAVVKKEVKVGEEAVVDLELFDNEKPTIPSNILFEESYYNSVSTYRLYWDPAEDVGWGIGAYETEISKDGQPVKLINTSSRTAYFRYDGPFDGGELSFKVRSLDRSNPPNYSDWSSPYTIPVLDRVAPTKPTNVKVVSYDTTTHSVSWLPSQDRKGVREYNVEQLIDGNTAKTVTTEELSVLVPFSSTASKFQYRVRASDWNGNVSDWSEPVDVTTEDKQPPTVPTDLKISNVAGGQEIGWVASADDRGIKGYELKVRKEGAEPLVKTLTETHFMNPHPDEDGQLYFYMVRAFDTSAPPNFSNWTVEKSLAIADKLAPLKPTNVKVENLTESTQRVSWSLSSDLSGISQYTISQKQGANQITSKSTVETTYIFNVPFGNVDYSYTVTASDKSQPPNNSIESDAVTLKSIAVTLPSSPTQLKSGLKKSGLKRSVTLTWLDNASDEDGYEIWRYDGPRDKSPSLIGNLPTGSVSYEDQSVRLGKTYGFVVRAFKNRGNQSDVKSFSKQSNRVNLKIK